MKTLAHRIERELQTGEWKHCAVYEDELKRLWPLFKSAREKSEDVMRNGVKRLKKMDVEGYAKPIRKRWRAWTR